MRGRWYVIAIISVLVLSGCSSTKQRLSRAPTERDIFISRLPTHQADIKAKTVVFDPKLLEWGAYDRNGNLIRSGRASGGKDWCPDTGRPCRTEVGKYRITRMGDEHCKSRSYPINPKTGARGGAPMPYCMFFHGGLAIHGSDHVPRKHSSHGCVRVKPHDAEWLHTNFVNIGTRVEVRDYAESL